MDAEQAPQRDRINAKITQTQSRITGYNALKYALADLKTSFSTLNDVSDFKSLTTSNSQSSAFGVTTSAAATAGTYSIKVNAVAQGQRSIVSFASLTDPVDPASPASFDLKLSVGGSTPSVSVTDNTPTGLLDAINNSADFQALGVSAQLIDTGASGASDRYKIVITGQTGAQNSFTLQRDNGSGPIDVIDPAHAGTGEQSAANAELVVNGVTVSRPNNSVDDVITGVTLNLYSLTTGTASVGLSRDTSMVKAKIQDLVSTFNSFVDSMNVLADPKSTVPTYGGALSGDSLLRSIRGQIQDVLTSDSSSKGTNITALRDLGIMFDRNGKLELTQSRLDSALSNHFDEVVKVLTANAENQSVFSTQAGGVAGDMVKKLDAMARSTGLLAIQTKSAEEKVTRYNDDLANLDTQMQRLLDRYMKQFTLMDTIVGQNNSTKTSLQNSFDGMMAAYKR